jgi:hypothetical protein
MTFESRVKRGHISCVIYATKLGEMRKKKGFTVLLIKAFWIQFTMLGLERKANVWLGCHTIPSLPIFFIQEFKTSDSTVLVPGRLKVFPCYNTVKMVTLTGRLITSTLYLHFIRSLISAKVLAKSEHYSWHQHCVWKPYNGVNEFLWE